MSKPEIQTGIRQSTEKVIKEIIGKKVVYHVGVQSNIMINAVKAEFMYMCNDMQKKIDSVKDKYANLDAFGEYTKDLDIIVKKVLTKYDYPKKGDINYLASRKEIKDLSDKSNIVMKDRNSKHLTANLVNAFDVEQYLIKELNKNPDRFTVTITYDGTK